ncbi:MAG: hypothetical protein RLZZ502_1804 [Pseudomonadota bacterium]|jgi:cell division protein ZapA (FtsZ GTPase activity inhibitor)
MNKVAVEIDLPGRSKLTMNCPAEQEADLRAAVADVRAAMLRNSEQIKGLSADRNLLLSCLDLVLQTKLQARNHAGASANDAQLEQLTALLKNAI